MAVGIGSRHSNATLYRRHAGDGNKLLEEHLRVQGVEEIRIKLHRPISGKIKTVSLKREGQQWYACFSVECQPKPLPALGNAIGIDVGLESFAVLSNGKSIPNPRWYSKAEAKLRRAQRKVARRKRGSHRRRKAVALLEKVHARIWRLRDEFQHIESCKLIRDFGIIVIEQLNVKGLAGGILSKAVQDAGWASFFSKMAYQAESAGRTLIKVDPAGTSQTCLCGATVWKLLSDRVHVCKECGLVAPRDLVSAEGILERARISPSSHKVGEVKPCVV